MDRTLTLKFFEIIEGLMVMKETTFQPALIGFDQSLKGICFLLTGVLLFSLQDVFIKWISNGYPVHEILFVRSLTAIGPILLIAGLEGGLQLLSPRHLPLHTLLSIHTLGEKVGWAIWIALAGSPKWLELCGHDFYCGQWYPSGDRPPADEKKPGRGQLDPAGCLKPACVHSSLILSTITRS